MNHKTLIHKITTDQNFRIAVTKENFELFFATYLPNYIKYPSAPMHKEMFSLVQNKEKRMIGVVAFRSSAKSTVMTLANPLWSIMGIHQKKYVLIIARTQEQARQYLKNIRMALENNELLRKDLGPFQEITDEWHVSSIVLTNFGARITVVSTEQSGVRGTRHGEHRPDLIIFDDIEDLSSVKTREGRDKTHEWILSEAIPAGDINTRVMVVGNFLHPDSAIMRIKNAIEADEMDGIFKIYPIINSNGSPAWPGKYPTLESIEKEKRKIANSRLWLREYMLTYVPDEDQLVDPQWLKFYDVLPPETENFRCSGIYIAVDLAIAEGQGADFTAVVVVRTYGYGKDRVFYVDPYPINRRMSFPVAEKEIIATYQRHVSSTTTPHLLIEDVAFQRVYIQQLNRLGIPAIPFKVEGQDKRSRLAVITPLIQEGKIFFSKNGSDLLRSQLIGFPNERHDDLVDALVMNVLWAQNNGSSGLLPIIEGEPRRWHDGPSKSFGLGNIWTKQF